VGITHDSSIPADGLVQYRNEMVKNSDPSPSNAKSNTKRILVCDDDPLFRKTLGLLLRDFGSVVSTQNTDEALQILASKTFDLVLLDIQMRTPDEGLRAISRIRAIDPDLAIVMISGLKDFQVVREALRAGANDYLTKDFEPEEFKLVIERAFGKRDLETVVRKQTSEVARVANRYQLVGQSSTIEQVRKLIERFRSSAANVLISGETGTGKEIVARLLRRTLPNGTSEPFVAVDSATLHSQTAESILFGHEKGAFTGADGLRRGLFEEADGGVIFFDEIANMPLAIQAKLLRVLQEKEVVRMGSSRVISLDFRVIAATNRSLEEMAKKGEFLPDLIQRLNILPISIAPLRERKEDLPLLVSHFLAQKAGGRVQFTDDALTALATYDWPGNVRELSAHIDYSLAMIDDTVVDVPDLHPKVLEVKRTGEPGTSAETEETSFYDQMAAHEARLLREAYTRASGNVTQIALALGMDRSHLHTKLLQHGIHQAKARS
jgi:two-component system response regulator AtoC